MEEKFLEGLNAWHIFLPIWLVMLSIWFFVKIGKRKKWFKRLESKIKKDPQQLCPLCNKPVLAWAKMPDVTVRPNIFTLPWGKWEEHWKIRESGILACNFCCERAWINARSKMQEIYRMIADHRKRLYDELAEFQKDLITPQREKNGGKK